MSEALELRCKALIAELGLGSPDDVQSVTPLTGGVASDIAKVLLPDQTICVKFALPKLKVAADWHAPVHRNAAEYAWLSLASKAAPEGAIALLGHSTNDNGFAMEFVEGPEVYLWKSALLAGEPDRGEARAVADLLGRITHASTRPDFDPEQFQNRDDFRAIRIEPYLFHLEAQYPDLQNELSTMASMLYESTRVLVHGDVSPKNIMFRKQGPILLDAECATMGDASFDPAFCMNHLVLKAVHMPDQQERLLENLAEFWQAYKPYVDWEPLAALETRICGLLPLLMLARVDGKSPVEYLGEGSRDWIRNACLQLTKEPADDLQQFNERLQTMMKDARP